MFVGCKDVDGGERVYFAETDSNLNQLDFTEIPLGLPNKPRGITHDHHTKEIYIAVELTGIRKVNLDTMRNETVVKGGRYNEIML